MFGALSRSKLKRALLRALPLCLIAAFTLLEISSSTTVAAQLSDRSILIGSSQPGVVTTHKFTFSVATTGNIGSIDFEYCTNSPFVGAACSAPAGLNLSSAILSSQSGQTGFSIDPASTANHLIISRPAANAATG